MRKDLAQFVGGLEIDGAIPVSPDQQGRYIRDQRQRRAEFFHLCEPIANDAPNVPGRSGNLEARDVRFHAAIRDARWIAVHPCERVALNPNRKVGRHADCEVSRPRVVNLYQRVTQIAVGIGRSEKDEALHPPGMTGGEHPGDSAAVGVADNIGAVQTESIHGCSDAIGGGFETCIEACNPLGLAHVNQINCVDAHVTGEFGDAAAPG